MRNLQIFEDEEEKLEFEQIYRENYSKMYWVAIKILKRQTEAENAVHEAFLKLAEHFWEYKGVACSKMTNLYVTIAKNKAIDIIRKENHYSEQEIETIVIEEKDEKRYPEIVMENREQHIRIKILLQELPESLKSVLVLKFYYEYTNKEIAKILGISTRNVDTRLYRAKVKMKELIQHKIDNER